MEIKKNRKLQGSVLLTVVFVMAILIVFLFGTLTLAMAANNRAHVNYSSAQTGITARTVAESAIKALGNNTKEGEAYRNVIGNLKVGDSVSIPVTLSGDATGTMGRIDSIDVSVVGVKPYYDLTNEEWTERNVLKFTGTATLGGVTKSASIYAVKHLAGDDPGGKGGGAGFVTTANANLETQSNVYGGAYIMLPTLTEAKNFKPLDPSSKLKVNGVEVGKSLGLDNMTVDSAHITKTNDMFYLPNSGGSLEADIYVCTSMVFQNWEKVVFPGLKKGITVWGDLMYDSNTADHLNCVYTGDPITSCNFADIPYIYVHGTLGGNVSIGPLDTTQSTELFPMNVFCGKIVANRQKIAKDEPGPEFGKGASRLNCSIYCMDEGKDSIIDYQKPKKLLAWTGSVITKTKQPGAALTVAGDICSKGNMTLNNVEVNGNVRIAGDCTIGYRGANKEYHDNIVRIGDPSKSGYLAVGGNLKVSLELKNGDGTKTEIEKSGNEAARALVENNLVHEVFYGGKVFRSDALDGTEVTGGGSSGGNGSNSSSIDVEVIEKEYLDSLEMKNPIGYYYKYEPKYINYFEDHGCYVTPWGEPLEIDNYGRLEDDPDGYPVYGFFDQENTEIPTLYYQTAPNVDPDDILDPYLTDSTDEMYGNNRNKFTGEYVKEIHKLFLDYIKDGDETFQIGYVQYDERNRYYFYFESTGTLKEMIINDDKTTDNKIEIAPKRNSDGTFICTIEPFVGNVDSGDRSSEVEFPSIDPGETPAEPPLSEENSGFPYDDSIYPKYAERAVILGLDTISGVPKSETQIVQTIEEILTKVTNPYDFSSESLGFDKYDFDSLPKITDASQITKDGNDYVISESCTIDCGSIAQSSGERLVFKPGNNQIVINAVKLQNGSGCPIYIDDSGSGSVVFYIPEGGKMAFNGTLYTRTYAELTKNAVNLQYNSTKDCAGYIDLKKLKDIDASYKACPPVYVYGKGTFEVSNFCFITANIISPDLTGEIKSNQIDHNISNFMYNNSLVSTDDPLKGAENPIILGCFNANNITLYNKSTVAYIPDGNNGGWEAQNFEGEFWCKILYYDEY